MSLALSPKASLAPVISQGKSVVAMKSLRSFAWLYCAWFLSYAFLGKGFAYAGWGSFYVGEMLLALGIVALACTRRMSSLLMSPVGIAMICFLLWQVACTLPYLSAFGLDALRDSALWGYSVFACVTAALILRIPRSLTTLLSRYGRFARAYLYLGPIAWLVTLYLAQWLPTWPGTKVTIPLIKGDEYGVHLAGVFAFSLLGLAGQPWWALVILADAMLGMSVRSGLVAFVCSAALTLVFRPRVGRLFIAVLVGIALIVGMSAFDLHLSPPGAAREFSLDLLSRSLLSVVGDSERNDLESTKGWRLNWWRSIWDYTVEGPYFWTGKGYGVNLADSDGYQVGTRDEPLRSPHSSHLNFLARSGVPGFLLWMILQLTWATSIISSYKHARKLRAPVWPKLFAWIFCYWFAFMLAAGFDVFLEGPMAGIPFWTVFGIGWASHLMFRAGLERQYSVVGPSIGRRVPLAWQV
jgi:hypothetical protein